MKRTLAEIRSTCLKAARGAGCPWGLAEEAGEAARMLEAHGVPAVSALAALLQAPRACACGGGSGPACGISEAAAWSDNPQEAQYPSLAAPVLLLAPMLAAGGWRMEWPSGSATVVDGLSLRGAWPEEPVPVAIKRTAEGQAGQGPKSDSRPVDPADWAVLEAFAARTYVPETDESRAGGAGPDRADED